VGSLISTLWEKQKTISYITDGQVVPHDIEPASTLKLLLHLEGFRVNRDRLEKNLMTQKVEQ
jgi:flagellar biosynthesis protein FlhF